MSYYGYYGQYFLKSSYEYAYAKYLDYHGYKWTYEEHSYLVENDQTYTPDFFIYDDGFKLDHIVEIKGKFDVEKAINNLKYVENKYNIKNKMYYYNDLYEMYKTMPYTLHKAITEWINSDETVFRKSLNGELNPHYGINHSSLTKDVIGEKSKNRWKDENYREMMLHKLRKNSYKISAKLKGKLKTPREYRDCLICDESFKVLVTSKQKYCTQYCASVGNFQKATEAYVDDRNKIHSEIKYSVLDWAITNRKQIKLTKFNKISEIIKPISIMVELMHGVKDIRVICKAVMNEDYGRKELLKFLKAFVETK